MSATAVDAHSHWQSTFGRRHAVQLALLYLTTLMLVFGIQWWQIVSIQTSQDVIVLTPSDNLICTEVPQTLDSTYEATYTGFWDTDYARFKPNMSAYTLTLNGASFTRRQYKDAMQKVAKKLAFWGSLSVARNTLWTLMYWTTFSVVGPKMIFSSTANPGVVFDGQINHALLSSAAGVCNPTDSFANQAGAITGRISGSFDSGTKRLKMTFPVLSVLKNNIATPLQPCPGQGLWVDTVNRDRFSSVVAQFANQEAELSFDVRTALIAISLNINMSTLDALVQFESAFAHQAGFIAYVDPAITPPMDPVYCLDPLKSLSLYGLAPDQVTLPPICLIFNSFSEQIRSMDFTLTSSK